MNKTFTILHTNDMHSALVGMGPASDYDLFKLNGDRTRGGFARLAWLIAQRKAARGDEGPVLVLDAGDYSMGTAFGAATRETGGELQLMSRMGYDATTGPAPWLLQIHPSEIDWRPTGPTEETPF